jgi:PAS domain S-box-containing protein
MTLRQRLLVTLAPLLLLVVLMGGAGAILLDRVSERIKAILRENYDSVLAMVGLNEAVERIDSSFTLALLGDEPKARQMYRKNWPLYQMHFEVEKNNITILPEEQELVDHLEDLTRRYRADGDRFYGGKLSPARRQRLYFDKHEGLLKQFSRIKLVVEKIRDLNQQNMEDSRAAARRTADVSAGAFAAAGAAAALLTALLSWRTARSILQPIERVTKAAIAIGGGNLDQVVPVSGRDELATLAEAFNLMARQLRDFRRGQVAQLLRAQRTSQAAIDSFPDPILVIDPEGRMEMANPAALAVLGVPSQPGSPWQPPESLAGPLREALHQQRPFLTQAFDQVVSLRSRGEERAYLPQVLPIRDPYGGILGATVVLHDVTRFRLLDQIKSDLVATVSHELKTPLTSVRLVLHLLLEETVGPLTPKQSELLIDARDNAERLLNMIEHLLALARLERGRETLAARPERPEALLQAAADTARARADSAHVELVVEAPPALPDVAADPVRLGHALGNLLDNALTYTAPGGRVTLSASAGDGTVRLSVADTGSGIPPEHLPRVFERFFRVPGQSKGQGTGLGLAIVREIILAHHGSVSCESQPGQGTVFHLTLPAWGSGRGAGGDGHGAQ